MLALLFAATLFLSSGLAFFVEPMFAKMVLPLLGGSPAVWNTCVVFFQAMLLAGYAYAHATTSWLSARQQVVVHGILLVIAGVVLPIGVPAGWTPPAHDNPVPWLLTVLLISVGAPFLAVSASAPLLQKWFSALPSRAARDPYFLYSASNLGSVLALLCYPVAVEPWWPLGHQSWMWTAGYQLLGALLLVCAAALWAHGRAGAAPRTDAQTAPPARLSWRRKSRWLALSLIPSSLMLGVTTYLSTDIAAAPLLWVVPLTIYLLSFVVTFAPRVLLPAAAGRHAMAFLVVPLVLSMVIGITTPLAVIVPLHLLAFFACAVVLHGELAADRPDVGNLTEFYLWIAVGGLLGGIFNSLVAPMLFTDVAEYPIALVLACLFASKRGLMGTRGDASRLLLRFAVGAAVMLVIGGQDGGRGGEVIAAERTFFGVYRVAMDEGGGRRVLFHGTTIHGEQSLDPRHQHEPLAYYHYGGPLGQLMTALSERLQDGHIGAVGLGTGTMAAYAGRAQRWTFYEIDPAVERIARDPRYFTHLSDCGPRCTVVLGDARLSLAHAKDTRHDLLVFDAFSSDAIPVHLVTREALRLYLDRLAEDGILAFHISNRYLRLRPVLTALAVDQGLIVRAQKHRPSEADTETGRYPSEWVVMARSEEALRSLASDQRWDAPRAASRVWTDDFTNIVGVLKRGWRE